LVEQVIAEYVVSEDLHRVDALEAGIGGVEVRDARVYGCAV